MSEPDRPTQTPGRPSNTAESGLRAWPGKITLDRIVTIMGLLGLVFVVGGSILSAWNEWRTLLREAREHAQQSAFFLADHAQRLFEVADIALRSTTTETQALDWAELESARTVWSALRESNSLLPYVDNLWLNDATGRLRMSTVAFPSPASNAADRPIFAAVRTSGDMLVGDRIVGKVTHQPTFLVARRLTTPDGTFRGMVSATLDLAYFSTYWRRLDLPNHERIAVVRASGDILIASDEGAPGPKPATDQSALLAAAATSPEAGSFVPAGTRYGFYHRIGDLPLLLVVEYDRASIVAAWRDSMLRFSPLALVGLLVLVSLAALGQRQGRREAEAARDIAAARGALEAANRTLEDRVAERTADLRESNEEIQRYAYIVSHDLRAPLVNITGFAAELQGLRGTLFRGEPDVALAAARVDFDEALGFIGSSADKMNRLINAILALSREGRRSFRPEPLALTPLLASIADSMAHRAQTAGATIRIGALPALRSDRIAVEQIFSNLIDNAVKYLRPGVPGDISLSGERVAQRVIVRVADNGRGIDMRDRERVFDLFRRAGVQDRPGDGIGLAHVRTLVRRLGGRIELESRFGAGTLFTVEIPDMDDITAGIPDA